MNTNELNFLQGLIPSLSNLNLLQGNEDAVAFSFDNNIFVINSDSISWSTDAIPDLINYFDFGNKIVAITVSDIVAKGVLPKYFLCSVNISVEMTDNEVASLFDGIKQGCQFYKLEYLGGDLGSAKELVITGICIGISKKVIKRSTAQIGDLVLVSGPFGYTTLGFQHYLNKSIKINSNSELFNAINSKLNPKARIKWVPVINKYANSCLDSSDGLAISLYHLAKESNKKLLIENLPLNQEVNDYCKEFNLNKEEICLYGGEEFELVFTIAPDNINQLLNDLRKLNLEKPYVIGKVESGQGVIISEEKVKKLNIEGWDSFKDSRGNINE